MDLSSSWAPWQLSLHTSLGCAGGGDCVLCSWGALTRRLHFLGDRASKDFTFLTHGGPVQQENKCPHKHQSPATLSLDLEAALGSKGTLPFGSSCGSSAALWDKSGCSLPSPHLALPAQSRAGAHSVTGTDHSQACQEGRGEDDMDSWREEIGESQWCWYPYPTPQHP